MRIFKRKFKYPKIFRHKCKKKHLLFCGEEEYYWCKKCKKEFDFPWKNLPKK